MFLHDSYFTLLWWENSSFVHSSIFSPAHSVVVLWVAEAGGFQLAAHHSTGALVSRQVALQPTLTIHARPWDAYGGWGVERKEREDIHVCSSQVFFFIPPKHASLLIIPWLYHNLFTVRKMAASQILIARHRMFLTVLLHALSVSRSLSPEGNHRLCLSLVVQGLHTACSVGTGKEEARSKLELEHNRF